MHANHHLDRVAGTLLGTALGDAVGLPYEGLSPARVARRLARRPSRGLVGNWRFVSDDTEQTALVAEALIESGGDPHSLVKHFRRGLVSWFLRMPFGVGFGTLRACLRALVGLRAPGVRSAGNGAAMRAAIVGVHFASDPDQRQAVTRALARITHTDARAVQAAQYVAEVAARCALASPDGDRHALVRSAALTLEEPQILGAIARADALEQAGVDLADAARQLGTTGYAVHSVGICTFCFLRAGSAPLAAMDAAVRAGGDTDTHAAMVGAWVGALHGANALPARLLTTVNDGPFGPTHLRGLAVALTGRGPTPRWSWPVALARNLALYPAVVALGVARLLW